MSPDVPAFKFPVSTSDFNFELDELWLVVVDILIKIVLTLLTFMAWQILQKKNITLCYKVGFSLVLVIT